MKNFLVLLGIYQKYYPTKTQTTKKIKKTKNKKTTKTKNKKTKKQKNKKTKKQATGTTGATIIKFRYTYYLIFLIDLGPFTSKSNFINSHVF